MSQNIPDFQTLMLPFLKIAADEQPHTLNEIEKKLSDEFNLSEAERELLLPSGNQVIIKNRIGWVRTYLKKAGLIAVPQKGTFVITEEGKRVLQTNPSRIDIAYLKKLPVFKEWVNSYSNNNVSGEIQKFEAETKEIEQVTPSELIDNGYQQMNDSLSFEVVDKLKLLTDKQFEKLVLEVLKAMGYGGFREDASEHTGKSSDGGIDGLIREDKLGLDTIYMQAKQYRDITVPVSHVRDFAGSLLSKKARKGVFITLSAFPQSAYEFVNSIDPKIILINGKDLAKLMIEYNVGVSIKRTINLKDLDNDFFDEL